MGSIPKLEGSPGGGYGNPVQYSCLENHHGQKSLVGCSPWGRRVGDDWVTNTHNTHDLLVFGFVCMLRFSPRFANIKRKNTKLTLGGYLLKFTCLRKAQGTRKWEVRAIALFLLCIYFNHLKAVQTPVLVRAVVTSDRPEFQVVHLNREWGWVTKFKEISFRKTKPGKEQGGTRVSRAGECSRHLAVSDSLRHHGM